MRLTAGFLLVLASLCWGCREEEVVPANGAISGTIKPVGGARLVYLVRGTDTLKTTAAADGTFEIPDVPAGNYLLTARPVLGFLPPVPGKVLITGGMTMQAPPIRPIRIPLHGLFSVIIADTVYSGAIRENLKGDLSMVAGKYTFRFRLPGISGPDTFNTATNSNLKMAVYADSVAWDAASPPGSTGLKVTAYYPNINRADATFSFKAVSAGRPDIIGTNGRLQHIRTKP